MVWWVPPYHGTPPHKGQNSIRLLPRHVGDLSKSTIEQVNQPSIEALDSLGEVLLDFDQMDDLHRWLTEYQQQNQREDSESQAD